MHDVNGTLRESCGGPEQGKCTAGRECECYRGYTGPHCLVHEGRDPIPYDQPDKLSDVGFIPPNVVPKFLLCAFAGLVVLLFSTLQLRRHFDGYTPIPDAQAKTLSSNYDYQ